MSPSSFSFKLSVPNAPDSVAIIGEMARHVAEYAKLDGAVAVSFADRARTAAGKVLSAAGSHTLAVFAADAGKLTMTLGGESVSQPLP